MTSLCLLSMLGCSAGSDGPLQPIDLVVDELGITHVYARSDHDAFFGAGYAMARDRLGQMELNRRQADGTRSEKLGAAHLRDDFAARVLGFRRLGRADLERAQREAPDEVALSEAWAAGINRRIDEIRAGTAPLPMGLDEPPARWSAEDAYVIGKALAFGLSNTLDSDLLASVARTLVPDTAARFPLLMPAYDTAIVGMPQPLSRALPQPMGRNGAARLDPSPLLGYRPLGKHLGSNNWALDGAHSANGRPLLAGDPHQGLSSPMNLWPVQLSSPSLEVIGFAYPGTPMVELGHNQHVAWTATLSYADVMDLWDVEPAADRRSLTLGDGTHAIHSRVETVRVKLDDGSFEDHPITVEEVEGHGVLLPEEMLPVPTYLFTAHEVLFNWTGFRPTREAGAYLALDRARDLDDFEHAADLMEVGAVNFIAADAMGIDLRVHAAVPDRGDPSSHEMPWHILPGSDAASLWTHGDLPRDKLPHLRDPANGRSVTANNDPFGFSFDGNVENDPWYFGAFFANAARAYRIDQALDELGRPATREDLAAMQRDLRSPFADSLVPALDQAMAALDSDATLTPFRGRDDLKALASRLSAWDRRMDQSRSEPLIFLALEWFAARRAFADPLTTTLFNAVATQSAPFLLGALHNVLTHRFAEADSFLPGGRNALLVGALDDTAAWLEQRFGALDGFRFGDFNRAAFPSPFGAVADGGRDPVSGGPDTIFVDEAAFFDDSGARQESTADEMSLYRMAVSFDDDGTPSATIDFARGTREDPRDRHFADRQEEWLAGLQRPLPFRRGDVEAAAEERLTLR